LSSKTVNFSGPLSVAIPGEVRGYYSAKLKYGNPNVTWSSLIQPSIKMAEEGIRVSWSLAEVLVEEKENIFQDPGLR
jgi:gamma-glutamyltranspeptidase/glutathione hydrolase/leukotriene-C4 hydrolase